MDMQNLTLAQLRADFERKGRGSMSMPIAGCIVWAAAGLASLFVAPKLANLVLVICSSSTYPIALLVAKLRGENMQDNSNPLTRLMLQGVLMVNLLWALIIPVWMAQPSMLPLAVGIAFGLHWVLFSWIVAHPLGLIHAVVRTALVLGAWLAFPQQRVGAVAAAVVLSYLLSLAMMSRRIRTMPVASAA